MAAKHLSSLFTIGSDAIVSRVDPKTGAVTYQIGSLDDRQSTPIDAVYWGSPGIMALPAEATPYSGDSEGSGGGSAQMLTINMSGEDHIIGMRDLRTGRIFQDLKPGETSIHCGGENNILLTAEGSIEMTVAAGNSQGGSSTSINVNPSGLVELVSSSGSSVTMDETGNIVISGGGSPQPTATKVEIDQLMTLIQALQAELSVHTAAWSALAALSGPIVGAMFQPIAPPVVAIDATNVLQVTQAAVSIPLAMSFKKVSSD